LKGLAGSLPVFVKTTCGVGAYTGTNVSRNAWSGSSAPGLLAGADPRDLPLVMIAVYAVSLALAWRRYR
jgi:hypothetical protein